MFIYIPQSRFAFNYLTYSSISSSGMSSMWDAYSMHRRSSMLSVLVVVPAIGRFFVNHGALLNIQHVLVEVQFCPSQRGSSGKNTPQ